MSGRISAVVLVLAAWLIVPAAALAAGSWQVAYAPSSVATATATEVRVTFTNTGSTQSADEIGCFTVAIGSTFVVSGVRMIGAPSGKSWSASASQNLLPPSTTVRAYANGGGDRIVGGPAGESVTLGVTVLGSVVGTYSWTARAYRDQGCTGSESGTARTFSVAITLLPTPTPTPTGAPTSTPIPTPTPAPTMAPSSTPSGGPAGSGPPGSGTDASAAATGPPGTPATNVPSGRPTAKPASSADVGSASGPLTVRGGGAGGAGAADLSLGVAAIGSLGLFVWAVPAVAFSVPGLVVILAVLAQLGTGVAWVPVVRRKIGSFGPARGTDGARGPMP